MRIASVPMYSRALPPTIKCLTASNRAERANACNSLWMNYAVQQWRVNEVLQSRDLERLDNFILRFSADRQMMLENISRLMYLQESYLRLRRYYMSRGDVTDFKPDDSIRKMFEEVSAMKLDETSPRELRRYRILFRLLYYNCFPVHEEVVQEARDLVEFERLEFEMGKSSSSDLVVSLVRLMYISNSVGCWDEVEAAYHELQKLVRAEQSPWLRRWEIHAGCIIWLLWLRLGKVEQTLKHMEENASEGAAEGLDLSVKRIWYSSHMVAYLWGAQYDLLERVALQMEQLLSSSLTDQKFIELRLILMICAYKSNDVVLFNSLYRSSVRAFRKLGFEDLSLKWFCDALNAGRKEGNAVRKEILRSFYDKVYQHPEPQSLFIYREKSIFFWIEAEWKGVKVEALFKDADFLKRWPI